MPRASSTAAALRTPRFQPTRRDRRRAQELAEALRGYDPSVSARELISSPLVELLGGTRGGSYSLTAAEDRIRVSGIGLVGVSAPGWAADLERSALGSPGSCLLYDATRPEPAQRNEVVHASPREYPASGRALLARHGMGDCWQLRVLVCDGPCLLAWVGALREDAFTAREHLLLRSLVPVLRERLVLERHLDDAPLALSALPAVLEGAGTPAFLLRPPGAVLLANSSGRALIAADRQGVLAGLRADADGRGPGRFAVTRLAVPGCPVHLLALLRPRVEDPGPRAAAFAARHGLTARQSAVVGLAARGLANKTIAAHLRCAESTVEMHLTAVYARAQVASRAELVARLWAEPA